jgi:hypothetical protein
MAGGEIMQSDATEYQLVAAHVPDQLFTRQQTARQCIGG